MIPDVIDPGGYRCVQVYIPDDDLYFYAFMGSYAFLTQWLAWEKDGTQRASQAARVWRDAYQMTRDGMDKGCVDMDELIGVFEECCNGVQGRLTQIVNKLGLIADRVGGSSGCTTVNVENNFVDDTEIIVVHDLGDYPDEFENEDNPLEAYKDEKCRTANGIVDALVYTMNKFAEGGMATAVAAGAGTILVMLSILVPGAIVITAPGLIAIIGSLIALVGISGFTWELFSSLATCINANRQDIVCALYNGSSSTTMSSNALAVINGCIDDILVGLTPGEASLVSEQITNIVTAMLTNKTVNAAFRRFDKDLFGGNEFLEANCSSCDGDEPVDIISDHQYLHDIGDNTFLPMIAGDTGLVQNHQEPFYSGDGHACLSQQPDGESYCYYTNTSLSDEFTLGGGQDFTLVGVEFDVRLPGHGSGTPDGNLVVTMNPGDASEQVFEYPCSSFTSEYQTVQIAGAWNWDGGVDFRVMEFRLRVGGLNRRIAVGQVRFYLNDL